MPNVPPTTITTDSPKGGELNLADGFALFPWLGALRTGVNLNKGTGTFLEKTINFEFIKLDVGIFHSTFIGACGPSYATEINTEPETSYTIPAPGQPASASLVLGDHALRGGFQYGIDFEISFAFTVDLDLVVEKKRLVDIDAAIDIDVIQLIIFLVKKLLGNGGGGQAEGDPNELELSTFKSDSSGSVEQMGIAEGEEEPPSKPTGGKATGSVKGEFAGSGMVDVIADPWYPHPPGVAIPGAPKNTLEPSLSFDFSMIPLFAEVPFLDILYGFNETLEAIEGGFGLGPGLAVGFPVTVTLEGATIDNHPFDPVSATGEAGNKTNVQLAEQTPVSQDLAPLREKPEEIGVLLKHEVGFSVGLYFFVELSAAKVINLGARTGTLPLVPDVPLPKAVGGPFHSQLSFVPGGGPVPFPPPNVAPTVGPYTANQPQGRWKDGVLARYGVSFFSANYESPIGPLSAFDPQNRFFAFPELSNIEIPPFVADNPIKGRNIYRQFNDGSELELVGTINDVTSSTFTDTKP